MFSYIFNGRWAQEPFLILGTDVYECQCSVLFSVRTDGNVSKSDILTENRLLPVVLFVLPINFHV